MFQVDDALLEQQREAYKVQGVDNDEVVTKQQLKKKRKQPANGDEVGRELEAYSRLLSSFQLCLMGKMQNRPLF
jgi:hypothetical protein